MFATVESNAVPSAGAVAGPWITVSVLAPSVCAAVRVNITPLSAIACTMNCAAVAPGPSLRKRQEELEAERQRGVRRRVQLDVPGVRRDDADPILTWKFIRPGVVTMFEMPPRRVMRRMSPTWRNPAGMTTSACGLMTLFAVVYVLKSVPAACCVLRT
jgi:hypothetical protein